MSTRSHPVPRVAFRSTTLLYRHKSRTRSGCRVDWSIIAMLFLVGVVDGCNEPAPSASATQEVPPPVVGFVEVREQTVQLHTELPGRTVAVSQAEVRPQVGGILKERKFEEGAKVEAGQVLYVIDSAVYRTAVGQAEAALASAEAAIDSNRLRAERYQQLLADEAVSKQEADDALASYHEATAAVAGAQASLAAARLDLSYTQVRAPVSGRVGLSQVTPGALVAANQETALTTIRNLDPIYVDFVQSSVEMLRMRKRLAAQGTDAGHAEVELILEDGSHFTQKGRLLSREVTVDEATGAVTLRAEFPNPNEELLPGMYVRVVMTQGVAHQAVLAPQRGVSRNPRAQAVAWVIGDDGKAQQRTLEVAQTVGTCWLVTKGLAQGDRLIVEGTQGLAVGAPLAPHERPELARCDLEHESQAATGTQAEPMQQSTEEPAASAKTESKGP